MLLGPRNSKKKGNHHSVHAKEHSDQLNDFMVKEPNAADGGEAIPVVAKNSFTKDLIACNPVTLDPFSM